MSGQVQRVGVREFREELARYLESPVPIAVTRHGQTVGYFVPALHEVEQQDRVALDEAVRQLEGLLAAHGVTEDEIVREFRAARVGTTR